MRAKPHKKIAASRMSLAGSAALLVLFGAAGCSGGSAKPVVVNTTGSASLPTPSSPGTTNTYIGTQSPGVWSLTLNDTSNSYSYQPVSFPNSPNTPVTGSFTGANGFLSLGQANGSSLGYILEVPGRMALLRPGNINAPLVVGVPQTSCYAIPYRLRFEYIGMDAANPANYVAEPFTVGGAGPELNPYGSVVVDTGATGANWTFQDLQGNTPYGPAGFSGTCSTANGQAGVSLSGEGLFNQYNFSETLDTQGLNLATTFAMGPSGIFIVDQTDTSQALGSGAVGVAQPASALSTAGVAAGQYLGFLTQAPTNASPSGEEPRTQQPTLTSPISFGLTAGTGTTLVGGDFPNDDVTQTPNTDISITLGTQDSTINGLYPSAKVTTLDPAQNCATFISNQKSTNSSLTNGEGFITCTYPAVAVVGNPEGKYAIFITTYNFSTYTTGTAMQIYLYQQ